MTYLRKNSNICVYCYLLPPVNEVWAKVVFLHMSVVLSMERGGGLCMMSLPVWLPGPRFLSGGLCFWYHVPSRGICLWSHVPSRGFLSLIPWSFQQSLCLWFPVLYKGGYLSLVHIPSRGVSLTGSHPGQRPMYGKERAVRIRLKCNLDRGVKVLLH